MDWQLAYTPGIWPSALTALVLIALAMYSWRRRSVPGTLQFAFGLLFAALWMAGISLEAAAVAAPGKIFWIKFQAAWLLPVATAVTCFLLEYAWPGHWLGRRNLVLLSIPCLLAIGLILTNDLHHLVWQGFVLDGEVIPLNGPGNWAFLVYGYALGLLNLGVLTWLFIRSPQHRWPVALMMVGQIGVRAAYGLGTVGIIHTNLPVEVIAFWLQIPMYAIALFGFRLFDPIPMARQTAIEQLRDGMLVVDPRGRVASLNPAAEHILEMSASRARNQPVRNLLSSCYPNGYQVLPNETQLEFSLPARGNLRSGDGLRHYILETSPLKDWRGLAVGRLLLLHDVTEQKQAQAQIVEQQRSLAMLHEREQLARELHDSTAQVLGYADFQLEAVSNHIEDGQAALSAGQAADASTHLAAVGTQLTRLHRILEDAHADLREYILNLRLAPSDRQPFFATLQSCLDGFTQNYEIPTELLIGPGVDEGCFAVGTQLQLLRIVQEALSNARKHSAARCVQVKIEARDSLARISIQDNGRGFDPDIKAGDTEHHFGLRFMRERAEQIGGNLHVVSAPGQGTCVIVDVPMKG